MLSTVIMLGAAAMGSDVAAATSPRDVECAVAERVLSELSSRPANGAYYSFGPVQAERLIVAEAASGRLGLQWSGQAPKMSTLRILGPMLATSALSCPNVRQAAARSGEVLTEADAAARLGRIKLNGTTVLAHRLTLPAVSADGREAVVAVQTTSNQLAGGLELIALHKRNGRWEVSGRKVLIVS